MLRPTCPLYRAGEACGYYSSTWDACHKQGNPLIHTALATIFQAEWRAPVIAGVPSLAYCVRWRDRFSVAIERDQVLVQRRTAVARSPMNAPWLPTTKQLALVIYAATLLALNSVANGQPRPGACGYYTNSAGNWVPRPC